MAIRWAVAGLVEAAKRFHKIRGYREMPQLIAALDAICGPNGVDMREKVA
jgi:hypothetical protein